MWSADADGGIADHRPVTLVAGLGNSHHAIRTNNPGAQRFFDQGMDYLFAFNHDEARRSFARAAELDPKAAMPWWGVALAVGPNYNDIDIGHARAKQAVDAIARAKALAVGGPAVERDYVDALAQRYSADLQTMGRQYAAAMKGVVGKYPDDLDAATLFAESLMDLHPWQLWSADGRPTEGTEEIVATLKGVLARDPNHVGANHFMIHAVEASGDPGWRARRGWRRWLLQQGTWCICRRTSINGWGTSMRRRRRMFRRWRQMRLM